MPRKFDDPSAVTIADMIKNPEAYAAEIEDCRRSMVAFAAEFREVINANHEGIRRLVPDFDGSDRSFCKLAGTLSKHYPGEPLNEWHELPVDELLGYIDAAVGHDTNTTHHTDKGVSLRDVGTALDYMDDELKDFVRRFVDSGKIKAKPIGKCTKDGRAKLYRLSEILSDLQSFSSLNSVESRTIRKHLESVERHPAK